MPIPPRGRELYGNAEVRIDADGVFVYWTPDFLGDDSLSAEQWERRACSDSYAGTKRFGNHKCRKNVCLKQKTSRKFKRRMCRFRYWHFEKVRSKKQRSPACDVFLGVN